MMEEIASIPALGFGTYGRRAQEGQAAIETALETGYRHLDTAQTYNTEAECGRALKVSGLTRDEVFVTTKITPENFGPDRLIPSLETSLTNLALDTVDLTLIHWPSPHGEVALATYLEQLAEAQSAGLTRLIGVSNFTIALIDQAISILGPDRLTTNQVELHPYLQNRRLAAHCAAKNIAVTAYRPIYGGGVNDDATIRGLAEKHAATPAQITLAFLRQLGHIAIPTSGKPRRIRENFASLTIALDPADMEAMRALDRGQRHINPTWGPDWDV